MKNYIIYSLVCLSVFLAGCTAQDTWSDAVSSGQWNINFVASRLHGEASSAENDIHTVTAFRFEDNLLKEVIEGKPTPQGQYQLQILNRIGDLYFIANPVSVEGLSAMRPGASFQEFMRLQANKAPSLSDGLLMTGMMQASQLVDNQEVRMRRAVARIDLHAAAAGVQVKRAVLKQVAQSGYMLPQQEIQTPEHVEYQDIVKEYSTPLANQKEVFSYLYEQQNNRLELEVTAMVDGHDFPMKVVKLPASIKRNVVYTVKIYSVGAKLEAAIQEGDWENGEDIEGDLQKKPFIDVEASEFGDSIRWSAAMDTLYIPHTPNNFKIALRTEESEEIQIEGIATNSQVKYHPESNTIQVENALKMPGVPREFVDVNLLDEQQVVLSKAVLAFQSNPVVFENTQIQFDAKGNFDYGRYVEGELAKVTVPSNKKVELRFEEEDGPWMQLKAVEDKPNNYRLLGGWRPNDSTADGRKQTMQLRISDLDGRRLEVYSIQRINQGLPVVKIGNVWWCKYNMCKNSSKIEDQISIAQDREIESKGGVFNYLSSLSGSELYPFVAYQYQGGNVEGLKLSYNEEVKEYYYDGMKNSAQDFGAISPTAMVPDGYEIPDYDNWRFFGKGNDNDLGRGGTYNNNLGQTITLRYLEKNIEFLGHPYGKKDEPGKIAFYEFKVDGNVFVMYGLGHQWEVAPGKITFNPSMLMWATSGKAGQTWIMESWFRSSKTNWFKYTASNSTKTRTLRCIKTPVEYIY